MIILVLLFYYILAIYEFIPLYKQKMWKDFWVNGVLGSISFASAVMLCFDLRLPSPAEPIRYLVISIFGK